MHVLLRMVEELELFRCKKRRQDGYYHQLKVVI